MQTTICGILDFLDGKKQYIVPLFQRSYTWGKPQWDALWEDITGVMQTDRSHRHFMGAIVSVPVSTLPVGVNKALLIDGQQRLTTMSLLMCALRDIVLADGDTRQADEITDDLLTNRHAQTDTERYKLLPTQTDRGDYASVVDGRPLEKGGQVAKAYDYFKKAIKSHLKEESDSIPLLRECLKSRLYVVAVALGEDEDPHLIFESLNAKGSGLAASDLVRNFILMKFPHQFDGPSRQQSIHDRYWQPLENRVPGNLIEFFFHAMIADRCRVPKKLVYSGMKAYLWPAGSANTEELMEHRLERLLDDSRRYARLLNPPDDPDDAVASAMTTLKAINSTVLHPVLLLLLRDFDNGVIGSGDLDRCFRIFESWIARRTVCNLGTTGFNKLVPDWCRQYPSIDHVNWVKTLVDKAAAARTSKMPSDAEVAEAFLRENFYNLNNVNKFVLDQIEAGQTKETVDSSGSSIEHIMPQSWRTADGWGRDAAGHGEPEEDIDALVHTIGNLTLTGYNPELGNKPFAAKRALLHDSGYALNRMVAESETWDAAAIRARGKRLAELFCQVWPRTV